MKNNIFLFMLLLSASTGLQCGDGHPRASAKVAPEPIETSYDEVIFATNDAVTKPLTRQDGIRATHATDTGRGVSPQAITEETAKKMAERKREELEVWAVMAGDSVADLAQAAAKEALAEEIKAEKTRISFQKQQAAIIQSRNLSAGRDSDYPPTVSTKKQTGNEWSLLYSKRGYDQLPLSESLVVPHVGHKIDPNEAYAQINLIERRFTLHLVEKTCYAVYSNGEIPTYLIFSSNGFAGMSREDLMFLSSRFNNATAIKYGTLYCINKYMQQASAMYESVDRNYEVKMIISGQEPYTIRMYKDQLYAIQPKDEKTYIKAIKDNNKDALFSLLLFNRLLHTPLSSLYIRGSDMDRNTEFKTIRFEQKFSWWAYFSCSC